MAEKAVAAASEAIGKEPAKIQVADRSRETQALGNTTQADGTTTANGPVLVGETQQDLKHISPASQDNTGSGNALATREQLAGTLSEPDKVAHEDVPAWTTFADLSIEQKFKQARAMGFEVRDEYLRERCRAAQLEIACASSALDRAIAIIEASLPFFIVHFEEMDAQGERSDLKGKVAGKTEWLRQNVPNLSKGTFYAALNAVKARHAEQMRLMLGAGVPLAPAGNTRTNDLTPLQTEVWVEG